MKHAVWKCLLVAPSIFSVSSCTAENPAAPANPSDPETTSPQYDRSTYPGMTWTEANPVDVNMSQAQIDQSMNYAFTPGRNTQSVLVIRHGVIVAERYATFPNNDENGVPNPGLAIRSSGLHNAVGVLPTNRCHRPHYD